MKPKRDYYMVFLTLGVFAIAAVIVYFVFPSRQQEPGIISGVYYAEGKNGKVIVINDIAREVGGSRGSRFTYHFSYLIELDAATGKEIKRKKNDKVTYIGSDAGKLWMVSGDTNVRFHSMDPFSLEVVETYKPIIEKIEAKNPVLKGKIASWEADKKSGNILVTSFDASEYYVNPITFVAHDCTNERHDVPKPNGLRTVGIMEQNPLNRFAYTDSSIYQLDGNESKQLFQLDKYRLHRTNIPGPYTEPNDVFKKHVMCEQRFIDGAFVYDAFTEKPLHFEGDSGTFIYHLDRLGKGGGHDMLTHVDASGKIKTQYDITQTKPDQKLLEAFVADGKLFLVFQESVQARDISGKLLWQYNEDTMTHDN